MFRRIQKLVVVFLTLGYCIFSAYFWIQSTDQSALSSKIILLTEKDNANSITSLPAAATNGKTLASGNFTIHSSTDFYEHPLNPKFPLSGSLQSPKPLYTMGNLADYLDVIIGITTVKREKGDYLLDTIYSLQNNLGVARNKIAIVVYIGEIERDYIFSRTNQIVRKFPELVSSGFLQIVSPPVNYYPSDWNAVLESNFNDPIERVKWRSKQNLDQLFLMMYIFQYSPTYYLMMEDDVTALPNYMQKLLEIAEKRKDHEWFFLSFSDLGAIGKLFRSSVLPSYATFIHTFWNKKPLDWLQDDYVSSSRCSPDEAQKACNQRKSEMMVKIRPSLFQHMGKFSSLNGKIQNRKDKYFPKPIK